MIRVVDTVTLEENTNQFGYNDDGKIVILPKKRITVPYFKYQSSRLSYMTKYNLIGIHAAEIHKKY